MPTGLSPFIAERSSSLRLIQEGFIKDAGKPHISSALRQKIQFALCRFLSPILTASQLISFPAGNKMFQFPALLFPAYAGNTFPCGKVGFPFGDPGFYGCMRLAQAYRSLPRPSSLI
jgi:hypothetical protein